MATPVTHGVDPLTGAPEESLTGAPGESPGGPVALSRATVHDVARLAGVSSKTVSRVVSGQTNVSPATRDRVLDAVRRLRFRPNHLARDLRAGGVSTTVAFVMADLTNPFYSRVAAGIERALARQGLTMVIAATADDPTQEAAVVKAMLERRVHSLLIVPIADDQSYLEGERQLGTSVVCIDRPAQHLAADSVVFANESGAFEAVTSMIAAGHRRIAYVGSSPALYTHGQRLGGYRQALLHAGLRGSRSWERTDAPDAASAERATQELLSGPDAPTAVLGGNNRASTGVLRALHRRGAGAQPAFVGFDDFDLADALGISVVAHDPEEMGAEAARLALAGRRDAGAPPRQVVLPTHLVQRGSGERPPPPD